MKHTLTSAIEANTTATRTPTNFYEDGLHLAWGTNIKLVPNTPAEVNQARAYVARNAPDLLAMLGLDNTKGQEQ